MASFRSQMELHQSSRSATAALEASSRDAIELAFVEWEHGTLDAQSVRWRLESIVRSAYRSSAAVARSVAIAQSGLDDWTSAEVFNTEYLQDLLEDVRRNLRAYKAGELSLTQAVGRIAHSAGVAAQRGYTDQVIASYTELEDFGLKMRKYWVANFVDNVPCPACSRLHGTYVGLRESFKAETGEPGVYRDLLGPPRHPNCQCRIYIFTVTLENAFDEPNFETPQDTPEMMTTDQVKSMPENIFQAARASLRALLKFFRGKR